MVRGTPDTRPARENFAAKLHVVRAAEREGQRALHDLRIRFGRSLRPSDVSPEMIDAVGQPVYDAQKAGMTVLGDAERVEEILTRAFQLEKRRVDRETGIDILKENPPSPETNRDHVMGVGKIRKRSIWNFVREKFGSTKKYTGRRPTNPFAVSLGEVARKAISATEAEYVPGLPFFVLQAEKQKMAKEIIKAQRIGGECGFSEEDARKRAFRAAEAGIRKVEKDVHKPEFAHGLITRTQREAKRVANDPTSTPTDRERASRLYRDAIGIAKEKIGLSGERIVKIMIGSD